jgi:hypothetical protein
MTICAHTGIWSDTGHLPIIREAHTMTSVATTRLPWSEPPITFDKNDQPEHSIDVGRFPVVISAVLETIYATKIFMDGGSDSNLIY